MLFLRKITSIFFGKKSKWLLKFLFKIMGAYLTLFVLTFTRYEVSVFMLYSKVNNLVMIAEGQNSKMALERIPSLQSEKVPFEPRIYNPISIFKSLFPRWDHEDYDIYRELRFIILSKKQNLENLKLNGIRLEGRGKIKVDHHFSDSHLKNVSLIGSHLSHNIFSDSIFETVDLWAAQLKNNDFAFAKFYNSDLTNANLSNSNLCGVIFTNSNLSCANFQETNLIGADLSSLSHYDSANFNRAYYNSMPTGQFSDQQWGIFSHKNSSCLKKINLPPTKFPTWFNPKKHGMIDVSTLKLQNNQA